MERFSTFPMTRLPLIVIMNGRTGKSKIQTQRLHQRIKCRFDGKEEISGRLVFNDYINDFVLFFSGALQIRLSHKLHNFLVWVDHFWQIEQGTNTRITVNSCQSSQQNLKFNSDYNEFQKLTNFVSNTSSKPINTLKTSLNFFWRIANLTTLLSVN